MAGHVPSAGGETLPEQIARLKIAMNQLVDTDGFKNRCRKINKLKTVASYVPEAVKTNSLVKKLAMWYVK
jgi:hypothetical protein